jgi:hypothetical protein
MTDLKTMFDIKSFEDTAKVVFEINDTWKEQYEDWTQLMSRMESFASLYSIGEDAGFFSTGGFVLTAFNSNGKRHVVASVMTYCVDQYIKERDQMIKDSLPETKLVASKMRLIDVFDAAEQVAVDEYMAGDTHLDIDLRNVWVKDRAGEIVRAMMDEIKS